jgi:alanine transaminase
MDLLVNPPNEETCSISTVKKYKEEVHNIIEDLKTKALMIHKKLNSIKGFKCNEIEGAMYAFPSITFPKGLIKEAQEQNIQPDYFYCIKLLENTGLVTVPGSGFGQKEGTYHIRLTNLICPKEDLMKTLNKIEEFNETFFAKY